MQLFTRLYIRLREAVSGAHRGQTYSEYALIFVCIVIALVGGYQLIGNNLTNSVSGVADQVGNA
jgi:Flp pilus assembly pilin Flp